MIERLYLLMARIGITTHQDKVLHAIAGFLVGAITMYFFIGTMYPVLAVIAVGLGKELYDEYEYGGFDFFDLFVTLLGGFFGIVITGLIIGG